MSNSEFRQYKRKQVAELRPVTDLDIFEYEKLGRIPVVVNKDNVISVSISDVDEENGSPKSGDMIARNPKNHLDQWLVAKEYFENNFEEL